MSSFLYKKGTLLQIFSNKEKKCILKDCIKLGKAGGTPRSNNSNYYNGKIPFLSISDITSQNKYIFHTEKHISELGLKNSTAWLIPENSLILSMYASYGLATINKIELSTSQAMFNMIIKNENNVEYIYYYLEYLQLIKYYDKLVSTGTQSNLNSNKVINIPIFLPNTKEQQDISNMLGSIDIRINLELKKNNLLNQLKKGLMQDMFV